MLNWTFLCDFDGTIVADDVTDLLLERFAGEEWRTVEREWQAGSIGSRECLQRQVALLRITPAVLELVLGRMSVDPAFPRFVALARSAGCDVRIASEGFDKVIRTLLAPTRIGPVSIAATHLVAASGGRWGLSFPHARSDCRSQAATCKCAFAAQGMTGSGRLVVIGDGLSDRCVASRADLVLARGRLLDYCRENAIKHEAAADFDAVLRYLEPIVREATHRVAAAAGSVEIDHA